MGLTDIEYNEIKRRVSTLEGSITGAKRDEEKFTKMATDAKFRQKRDTAILQLYVNFLSDAVKEYEDAQVEKKPLE